MSVAAVKQFADALAEADKQIVEAEKFMGELECRDFSRGVGISIGGVAFMLTHLAPPTYDPQVVPGRRALHEAVERAWRERLIGLRSRREGLARSFKAAAEALAKEGGAA